MKYSDSVVELLASKFTKLVRKYLSVSEMVEVIRRNRVYGPGVCATHDFIDANEVMAEAFREVLGSDAFPEERDECELWSRAWDLAWKREFRTY